MKRLKDQFKEIVPCSFTVIKCFAKLCNEFLNMKTFCNRLPISSLFFNSKVLIHAVNKSTNCHTFASVPSTQ